MEKLMRTRKMNRLSDFDYGSNRCYFITVCTKEKFELFGEIVDGRIILSDIGKIVQMEIEVLKTIYDSVRIRNFVIMPNHVHFIVQIRNAHGKPTISQLVQQWKGAISKKAGYSPWQKLFHDHVIRNEQGFLKISNYIDNNIKNWHTDCFNPKNNPT